MSSNPGTFGTVDIDKLLVGLGLAKPKKPVDPYLTDIIAKNYDEAYNEIPESFIPVEMLYVNIQINDIPYNAFIDTGAQITIMPLRIAKELGILDLIYKGASNILKGVGTKKSIGKIFKLDIIIGSSILPCSFTIVEDFPDIILGLDMMKTHGCIVDLKKRGMSVGADFIHFLNSNEMKQTQKDEKK
jgi:DNA damage-inducible protein 1